MRHVNMKHQMCLLGVSDSKGATYSYQVICKRQLLHKPCAVKRTEKQTGPAITSQYTVYSQCTAQC